MFLPYGITCTCTKLVGWLHLGLLCCCVDQFLVHVIQYVLNLKLQILKVGRFSIGWFMLAARLVRAHLDFCTSWGQHNDFCCFKGVTFCALTLCYKLISFFTLINILIDYHHRRSSMYALRLLCWQTASTYYLACR